MLRSIAPYNDTSVNYVKGRWLNKTIIQVLSTEFKSKPIEYYTNQIKQNKIYLIRNDSPIKGLHELSTLKIQNKDKLFLTLHKHEPPVLNTKIQLIHNQNDLLVINKPNSIPVHPTGRYYQNTITEILKRELEIENIYPCHRIDRLTSGILILSTSREKASVYQSLIQNKDNGSVKKFYIARVKGHFKESTELEIPIRNIDIKLGFNNISILKPSKSTFRLIKYSPTLDESIVLCKPVSGRTHQLRIHLSILNHPIVKDPIYNNPVLIPLLTSPTVTNDEFNQLVNSVPSSSRDLTNLTKCEECFETIFPDPNDPNDLMLYLHSFKYVIDELTFETDHPDWCNI